jgi:hypothetical protein
MSRDMSTDLELRLGEVLRNQAEDAMERTDTHEQLDVLRQALDDEQLRRSRVRMAGVLAVAASLALAAVVAGTLGDGSSNTPSPAGNPEPSPTLVATRFLDAFTSFDVGAADGYLAPGAHLEIWGVERDEAWMNEQARWLRATGFTYDPGPCTAEGPTTVVCTFDYEGFGSRRLGRGPFTDSFRLTIDDGAIVEGVLTVTGGPDGFAARMWRPLAGWVTQHHPDDAALMYADWPGTSRQAVDDRAIAVWVTMVRRYQEAVEEGRAD